MNDSLESIIVSHPFFERMEPGHLEAIAQGAVEESFKADQILFREGEPADKVYLIRSGRIALEAHQPANGTVFVQNLGPGEVLGWSWLFPPFVWHLQARAVEPTRALVLDGSRLLVAAENNHEFGFALMKRVSQLLIERLQATRKELLRQQIESILEG